MARIEKLKKNGSIIYPATIGEAVVVGEQNLTSALTTVVGAVNKKASKAELSQIKDELNFGWSDTEFEEVQIERSIYNFGGGGGHPVGSTYPLQGGEPSYGYCSKPIILKQGQTIKIKSGGHIGTIPSMDMAIGMVVTIRTDDWEAQYTATANEEFVLVQFANYVEWVKVSKPAAVGKKIVELDTRLDELETSNMTIGNLAEYQTSNSSFRYGGYPTEGSTYTTFATSSDSEKCSNPIKLVRGQKIKVTGMNSLGKVDGSILTAGTVVTAVTGIVQNPEYTATKDVEYIVIWLNNYNVDKVEVSELITASTVISNLQTQVTDIQTALGNIQSLTSQILS